MPLSRSRKEEIRDWLLFMAKGESGAVNVLAVDCLRWIAELGSPWEKGWNNKRVVQTPGQPSWHNGERVEVKDERPQGPVVNPTPKDTMIQIRFRAKRSTVSISELPDETQD